MEKQRHIKVFTPASYTADVVESKNQSCPLPEDYRFIRKDRGFRLWAGFLYGLTKAVGFLYCKVFLRLCFQNRGVLKGYQGQGIFLLANHTQEFGDVVIPALAVRPQRIYTIASTANLGIPVIGKLLPAIGILPIPGSVQRTREFMDAVRTRSRQGHCVVVYPEAHVWPYYTGIRPFSATSFRFPVEEGAASFAMTTTYQKRRFGRRPKVTVYLDGPFFPEECLTGRKEKQESLRTQIHDCMVRRSAHSNYDYIRYEVAAPDYIYQEARHEHSLLWRQQY